MPRYTPTCQNDSCGKQFFTRQGRARFCSNTCRKEVAAKRFRDRNPAPTVSSGTRGAIGELIVCADLLNKGYEVFRSVSPSCSCDLAVLKDGKLLRIEVRTGHWTLGGKLTYSKSPKDLERSDVFAVIVGDQIYYIPDLPV